MGSEFELAGLAAITRSRVRALRVDIGGDGATIGIGTETGGEGRAGVDGTCDRVTVVEELFTLEEASGPLGTGAEESVGVEPAGIAEGALFASAAELADCCFNQVVRRVPLGTFADAARRRRAVKCPSLSNGAMRA